MNGERQSLSPADQEKFGVAMAEAFAKARAADELEQSNSSLDSAGLTPSLPKSTTHCN